MRANPYSLARGRVDAADCGPVGKPSHCEVPHPADQCDCVSDELSAGEGSDCTSRAWAAELLGQPGAGLDEFAQVHAGADAEPLELPEQVSVARLSVASSPSDTRRASASARP
jgi:hypothetical protein